MTHNSGGRRGPTRRIRALRLGGVFLAALGVGGLIEVGILSLQAARSVVHPPRVIDSKTPAAYDLPYESVAFLSADGLLLRGWFIPGGKAAVLLAHGHASSKASMLPRAASLRRDGGYSVLLFDFRASGESEGSEATLGYRERLDLLGAIAYLKTRAEVDPERIGALGSSMGAATLLFLGEKARSLRALVADSSFATAETLVGRFDRWFRLPSLLFSLSVPWAIERLVALRPSDVAPQATIGDIAPTPLLLIHGELDTGIPVRDAYALYEAAREPKELWIIPGAGHGEGSAIAEEEYRQRVLAFFDRYLGANSERQ